MLILNLKGEVMKKVILLSMFLMLASAVFAIDLKVSGMLSGSLSSATGMDVFSYQKDRLNINGKLSDTMALTSQFDLAGSTPEKAIKLLYVDVPTNIGSMRFGYQVLSVANMYGGLYQNSTYYSKLGSEAISGVALTQTLMGLNVSYGVLGTTTTTKKMVVKVATTVSGYNVSGYALYRDNGSQNGYSVAADVSGVIGPVTAYVQGFYDLNDNVGQASGAVVSGTSYARTAVNGGVGMDLVGTGLNVYGEGLLSLSDAAKTTLGCDSNFKVGVKTALSPDILVALEGALITVTGTSSTGLSAQAQINF